MSLGPSRSLTSEIDHQNDDTRGRMVYRRGRGASDIGLDYRIAAEAGDSPRRYDARVGYTASLAAGSIDLQRLDGENNMRGNLSGSVALMDGDLRVSRRLGRAFGLVSVPGYSDVRVYMDNRLVGETDDDGEILVPGLRPYENNRLSFEVDDLPLSASFGVNEKSVTPFDRTGVKVAFDVESLNEVTAHFFDDEGEPLPIGTTLASDDGDVHVSIGRSGFAHIKGDWDARLAVKGVRGDRDYRCEIDVPPADEILPDLGDVSCASTPL
jgi:outer membrane usher protein